MFFPRIRKRSKSNTFTEINLYNQTFESIDRFKANCYNPQYLVNKINLDEQALKLT